MDALDRIYREHWDFVRRSVQKLGIAEAHAEDVAQDVFVVAHRRLGTFEGRSALRTWLYGIARRVAKDHRRSAQRAERRRLALPEPLPAPCPEESIARRQAGEALGRALDHLDRDRRVVFELAEIQGLTAPQIGACLGLKTNTVYSRLRLARRSFHAALQEGGLVPAQAAANDAGVGSPGLAASA